MIRWLILLCVLIISAGIIGFGETSAFTEVIAKWIYFTTTILLIIALVVRDMMHKEV